MTIDGDTLFRLLTFAFTVGSAFVAWFSTRDKVTQAQIRELEQKVLKLEGDFAHVPNKETLHRLELGMQEVNGKVEAMSANWTSVTRTIQRLEEFLLEVKTERAPAASRRRRN